MNCLTQTLTRIMTFLNQTATCCLKKEKSNPTRELKDDLLDAIANNLNADEETDQDVSEKLARLVNKRWSEKLKRN